MCDTLDTNFLLKKPCVFPLLNIGHSLSEYCMVELYEFEYLLGLFGKITMQTAVMKTGSVWEHKLAFMKELLYSCQLTPAKQPKWSLRREYIAKSFSFVMRSHVSQGSLSTTNHPSIPFPLLLTMARKLMWKVLKDLLFSANANK